MRTTVADMIAAGALSSLCYHHHCTGASIDDWSKTAEFARREFPAVDEVVIACLIVEAQNARLKAKQWQSAMTLVSQLNG